MMVPATLVQKLPSLLAASIRAFESTRMSEAGFSGCPSNIPVIDAFLPQLLTLLLLFWRVGFFRCGVRRRMLSRCDAPFQSWVRDDLLVSFRHNNSKGGHVKTEEPLHCQFAYVPSVCLLGLVRRHVLVSAARARAMAVPSDTPFSRLQLHCPP